MLKSNNEKALKVLEQQFNSFINQQNHWDFFLGLAEYIKTIEDLNPIKQLIDELERQAKIIRNPLELMNEKAFKELNQVAKEMNYCNKTIKFGR